MQLISIVVPVYNVEAYAEQCIESILNQSYKNLQIILVDDGSTDRSGEICDFYRQRDSRIEVIHKKNGGLSDARNTGIKFVKAKYVTFADSDDILHEDYVDFLYKQLIEFDADIAICRYKRFTNIEETKEVEKKVKTVVFNSVEALKNLLYTPEIIPQSAYAKMYRTKLFEDIEYPVGKINEDIGTTYKLFYKAQRIAYNPSQYYFYLQRMDGIVRSNFSERTMDAIYFSDEIIKFVNENLPEIEKAAICYAFAQNVQVLMKLPYKDKKYQHIKEQIIQNIKQYRRIVLWDKNVSIPRRLGALASYGNLYLIKQLAVCYKRIINKEPV